MTNPLAGLLYGLGTALSSGVDSYTEARAYSDRRKAQQAEERRQQEMLDLHRRESQRAEDQQAWQRQEAARDNLRSLASTSESKIQLEQSLSPGFQPPATTTPAYPGADVGPFRPADPTPPGGVGPTREAEQPQMKTAQPTLAEYQFGIAKQGAETAQARRLAQIEAQHGKDAELERQKLEYGLREAQVRAGEGANTEREKARIATKQALSDAYLGAKTDQEREDIRRRYQEVEAAGGMPHPLRATAKGRTEEGIAANDSLRAAQSRLTQLLHDQKVNRMPGAAYQAEMQARLADIKAAQARVDAIRSAALAPTDAAEPDPNSPPPGIAYPYTPAASSPLPGAGATDPTARQHQRMDELVGQGMTVEAAAAQALAEFRAGKL